MKALPQEEYLTADEVATLLRISKRTLLKLAKIGKLGKKFGNQWRFKRSEIDNYRGDNQ
jgi:excisionase family DNA binding protein